MAARRWLRFYAVGAAGIAVQAGVFAALAPVLGPHYLVATALAVESAVLHNFYWHRRWTWADRREDGAWRQLLRFHGSTGATSLLANLISMRLLVGVFRVHPLLAGLLSIAACSVANFVVSDQVVFGPTASIPSRRSS